jgi:membrane protein
MEMVGGKAAIKLRDSKKYQRAIEQYFAAYYLAELCCQLELQVFCRNSINFIWGLKAKPNKGYEIYNKIRMSFSMMIASVGFLLMVSLVNTVMDVMYF